MAKAVRGLPAHFSLDIPDETPVTLGDFLDEPPPAIPVRRIHPLPVVLQDRPSVQTSFRSEVVPDVETGRDRNYSVRSIARQPNVVRYQLNLTPRAKTMLEEIVEHVRNFSPENNATTSEVFQGVIGLLHGAMGELELANLPRRGAWGSVTAKNFPSALSETFEQAIVETFQRRAQR